MKSKENDNEDGIDFSEKAFKKRFRQINGDELANLKLRIARARGQEISPQNEKCVSSLEQPEVT